MNTHTRTCCPMRVHVDIIPAKPPSPCEAAAVAAKASLNALCSCTCVPTQQQKNWQQQKNGTDGTAWRLGIGQVHRRQLVLLAYLNTPAHIQRCNASSVCLCSHPTKASYKQARPHTQCLTITPQLSYTGAQASSEQAQRFNGWYLQSDVF
jgi:hypothetical protein